MKTKDALRFVNRGAFLFKWFHVESTKDKRHFKTNQFVNNFDRVSPAYDGFVPLAFCLQRYEIFLEASQTSNV